MSQKTKQKTKSVQHNKCSGKHNHSVSSTSKQKRVPLHKQHRMLEVNKETMMGVCLQCGEVPLRLKSGRYLCSVSQNRWSRHNSLVKRPYLAYRKEYCENCLFPAVHSCQLDVHHKDENHDNNNPSNLMTLCANCHRLCHQDKTLFAEMTDYFKKEFLAKT